TSRVGQRILRRRLVFTGVTPAKDKKADEDQTAHCAYHLHRISNSSRGGCPEEFQETKVRSPEPGSEQRLLETCQEFGWQSRECADADGQRRSQLSICRSRSSLGAIPESSG